MAISGFDEEQGRFEVNLKTSGQIYKDILKTSKNIWPKFVICLDIE